MMLKLCSIVGSSVRGSSMLMCRSTLSNGCCTTLYVASKDEIFPSYHTIIMFSWYSLEVIFSMCTYRGTKSMCATKFGWTSSKAIKKCWLCFESLKSPLREELCVTKCICMVHKLQIWRHTTASKKEFWLILLWEMSTWPGHSASWPQFIFLIHLKRHILKTNLNFYSQHCVLKIVKYLPLLTNNLLRFLFLVQWADDSDFLREFSFSDQPSVVGWKY